jgi:hypothetical protein
VSEIDEMVLRHERERDELLEEARSRPMRGDLPEALQDMLIEDQRGQLHDLLFPDEQQWLAWVESGGRLSLGDPRKDALAALESNYASQRPTEVLRQADAAVASKVAEEQGLGQAFAAAQGAPAAGQIAGQRAEAAADTSGGRPRVHGQARVDPKRPER